VSDGLPSQDAINRLLGRFAEDRSTAEQVRKRRWALKTNRQKAEALIASVNPDHVYESELPKIALAQVHATLALKD
jgi:hypothetical protein